MKRLALSVALLVGFSGVPMLVGGCDTTEHSKTVEVKQDGTTVKKETKTTENPDGSVTKTEKKDVDHPSTP
jgi:hypothetical protein